MGSERAGHVSGNQGLTRGPFVMCESCEGTGDVEVVGPPPASLVLGFTACPTCEGEGTVNLRG